VVSRETPTSELRHSAPKENNGAVCQQYPLCFVVMFILLCSSINEEQFEKHLYDQSSHYEKYALQKEAIMCTTKSTLFAVSKDEYTKENAMKHALYALRYAKGTSRAEATLNNKRNLVHTLSHH